MIDGEGQEADRQPRQQTWSCAYDPADGKEIWRVRYKGYSVVPRPVFGHGLVFLCTGYDPPSTLLAIRPDGSGDVTETHVAWTAQESRAADAVAAA